MEYYPGPYEMEMYHFFQNRGRALRLIKSLGLDCPYISSRFTYEQLFLLEVERDFNSIERDYLKDGIVCIFECLKAVENLQPLTEKEAVKHIKEKYKDKIQNHRKLEGFRTQEKRWISDQAKAKITNDEIAKKLSIPTLKKELADFKIRLGRIDIVATISDDKIEFSEADQKQSKMEITELPIIENPYPEVFTDRKAFDLFERWHALYKDTQYRGADYGFIYRKMAEDGFIKDSFKPEKFRVWIGGEKYDITTDAPFKVLRDCTTTLKENTYTLLKTIQ